MNPFPVNVSPTPGNFVVPNGAEAAAAFAPVGGIQTETSGTLQGEAGGILGE